MISDEAVEAAASANYEARTGKKWFVASTVWKALERLWMLRSLEAAAPHLQPVVTTVEELDKLWLGSVVLSEGAAYQRYGNEDWSGDGASCATREVPLPATVLHAPNPYRSQA